MNLFTFARANDIADAVRLGSADGARYLGGGTNLVDLMRETIERPNARSGSIRYWLPRARSSSGVQSGWCCPARECTGWSAAVRSPSSG
jgi:hypothetical protein